MVCWVADRSLQKKKKKKKKNIAVKMCFFKAAIQHSVPFLKTFYPHLHRNFFFLLIKKNQYCLQNSSSEYYTYLDFLPAWYSGFKNEPCIITALCSTAFCFLPFFLQIQHGCAFIKHYFPLPLQQIWNVFWEMLKHPFEHNKSLTEDEGAID